LYLFEPHQSEWMEWKPDTFLNISTVWGKKRAAIECMEGQEHLWDYYTNVAENRGNHFRHNSGGQSGSQSGGQSGDTSGGRPARYAKGFQSVYPRAMDEL
jgi:4-oxalomesaconate hydratase